MRQGLELFAFRELWATILDTSDFFYSPYVIVMSGSIQSPAIDIGGPTNFWLSTTWRKFFKDIAYYKAIFERIGNLIHPIKDMVLNDEPSQLDMVSNLL